MRPSPRELAEGVRAGDRSAMGRAITLVESSRASDREPARELLGLLLPHTGGAHRVGTTGTPGVGKSTFIDELGTRLTSEGHRVAVLAVDPTSRVSGGSILGDKTRMARLATDPNAFIRPSPSAGTLGGVARRTRETMLIVEAAGYDVVLVETVGVGQSETTVAEMVDFFLLLMAPGGGDELQGIKKGVIELADMIAVNKADGPNLDRARATVADYGSALRLLTPAESWWTPPVVACSALTGEGVDEVWELIERHHRLARANGELDARRRRQRVQRMWSTIDDTLMTEVRHHPAVAARLTELTREVENDLMTPGAAADLILAEFLGRAGGG